MKRLGREILAGAGYGIAVALAYVMVEFTLVTLVPLITQPATKLGDPFWHAMALLLIGYIGCGAVLGAVAGALFAALGPVDGSSQQRLLAVTLLLPVVFAGNLLVHWPLSGGGAISVGIAALLLAALIVSINSEDRRDRTAFLTGPLMVSALLLLPLWISQDLLEQRSGLVRLAAIGAALFGITLLSFLLRRTRWAARTSRAYDYPLGTVALLGLIYATGLATDPGSPKLPQRANAAAKGQPNVILVVMDTVRADHTSPYGYERDTTPFLNELAKESTLYTRAFAVSDYTLPTHASMFTGLYPRTHGAYFAPPNYPDGRPLSPRFTTMATLLKANGYRTAGVVANSGYLAADMGFAQGFETYDSRAPAYLEPSMRVFYLRRDVRMLLDRFVSTGDFEVRSRRANEINKEVYGLLERVDSPFFLFVNYMDAHNPYVPPPPFDRQYPCANLTIGHLERMGIVMNEVLSGKRDLKPEEQTCLASGYDGGIAYLDSQIRELVGSLRSRGLYDNTLLIITGDHGEALGQRNQIGHGGISVYQNEVGVPLLVKYPGMHAGSQVDAVASQVDFLSTVLDVASIPEPAGLQGISLRKLDRDPSRFVVSVSYPHPWLVGLNRQYDRVEQALVFGDKKLVQSNTGKQELFNLSSDAKEEHNLYREGPSETNELAEMLQSWVRHIPALIPEDRGAPDRSTVERLKSLGYAQ